MTRVSTIINMVRKMKRTKKFVPNTRFVYSTKGRYIKKQIYAKLKAKRKCDKCGIIQNYPLEIDHIIPINNGGTNDENNLQVLCNRCHSEKHK